METLKIDKTFNTRQEMEEYEKELSNQYVIMLIVHKDQVIGEPDIYGIDSIMHFGKRG